MSPRELTASQENYLEAVLVCSREDGHAHVKEVADRLAVRMASVSEALRALCERGLVDFPRYGAVTLTESGRKVAEKVRGRHALLKQFLQTILGLPPEAAEENACRMEHAMDEEALERMADYVEFVENCPLKACTWQPPLESFCDESGHAGQCAERLRRALRVLKNDRGSA